MSHRVVSPRLTEHLAAPQGTAVRGKRGKGILGFEVVEVLPDELLSELCDAWTVRRVSPGELEATAKESDQTVAAALGALDAREAKDLLLSALIEREERVYGEV
jgi:hypothetical protein